MVGKRMEEMMAGIINSQVEAIPQNIPLPETPKPHIRLSAPPTNPNPPRFATSTPYMASWGRGNLETPHPQNIYGGSSTYNFNRSRKRPGYTAQDTPTDTPEPSPAETIFGRVSEIKLPEEGEFKGFLDAKKAKITFDGTDVEGFIKRLERIAMIQQCCSRNLAFKLPFILNNSKISRAIELMEGHKTGDWELLEKSLLRKWGRATPLRRYWEENLAQLVQKAIKNQGISTNSQ